MIRYVHEGRQREASFATKREAMDFKAKFEHDSRAQIFVDPKVAGERFATVAKRWLARHPGSPKTLVNYEGALRLHVLPVFGSKPLAAVANDREGVEAFLRETLPAKGLSASMVRTCHTVITGVVNDAIKSGRLNGSRLKGLALPPVAQKADIVFATHEQIEKLAQEMPGNYGFTIYLMRGCGLRLGESLGEMALRSDRSSLRLFTQLAADGKGYTPLKHRKPGDYRDIPLPAYVAQRVPKGERFTMYQVPHRAYRDWFNRARDAAGLPPSFTPHTLRHQFASIALAGGIPITDVSKWLGHKDINVTYAIYGHLVPESWDRARAVLDEEWVS